MLDHFTRNEILSFYYIILGAGIKNSNKMENVLKPTWSYPDNSLIEHLFQTKDRERFIKDYNENLKLNQDSVFMYVVKPILRKQNVILISKKNEDIIVDGFIVFLKNIFKIDCIDLNKLFAEGDIGEISYDYDKIVEQGKDIFEKGQKALNKERLKTEAGRAQIFLNMTEKEKMKKLKELGYNPSRVRKSEIDQIIHDEWIVDF